MPKLGDTTVNGSAGFDMTKDANGVWSFTTPKLTPSYYQYWFDVDGLTTPDPQNTFVRPASGVYKSVVALPGEEADFMMFRDVPHGNLIEHHYVNQLTKVARRVVVYTPPGYNFGNKKYPVVYLLHGGGTRLLMTEGHDDDRGNSLLLREEIVHDHVGHAGVRPAALVVVGGKQPEIVALQKALGYTAPPPAARGDAPRGGGPGGRGFGGGVSPSGWSMQKEMLDYVIPIVEKEFRVVKDKDHRAIMGYSMGGGHATSIGFGHPELFAYVGAFSGFGSTDLLTADPAKTNKNYKLIFIGSGTEDTAVNRGRTMHDALTKAGVKHMWSEDPGYGHDYQIWRQYFHRLMQQTFRD
jgi:enterochelin esterase family protein